MRKNKKEEQNIKKRGIGSFSCSSVWTYLVKDKKYCHQLINNFKTLELIKASCCPYFKRNN